jgi:hypothetical protein
MVFVLVLPFSAAAKLMGARVMAAPVSAAARNPRRLGDRGTLFASWALHGEFTGPMLMNRTERKASATETGREISLSLRSQ